MTYFVLEYAWKYAAIQALFTGYLPHDAVNYVQSSYPTGLKRITVRNAVSPADAIRSSFVFWDGFFGYLCLFLYTALKVASVE